MGERRQRQPETPEAESDAEAPTAQTPRPQTLGELLNAAQAIDQELDRQQRLYAAARALRDRFGASVQQVLTELADLEDRRAVLASEIGALEARLVELRAAVSQGEVETPPA
jgi:predicted  nucleic acid-binding Zn-ribbon protein